MLANPKDGEQRIFLGDFGIARNVGDISGLTATNMIVGTLPYAAPEQLMDDPIDGRADGAFRRKPTDASERYYPVPAPEVFKALNEVVPQLFNLKSSNDFTLCCTFTSDLQGVEFTRDPKYVVVPRRERLDARRPARGDECPGWQFPRFVRSSQRSP